MGVLLTSDGVPVTYREQGQGRPAVLLVHGAGASSWLFSELMRTIGRRRRTIAIDLPGHGRSDHFSPAPPPDSLLRAYRDVAAAAAEQLGLGRFVLAGHSMGGAIAQEIALAHSDRVAALVLITTGARLKVSPALLYAIEHAFDQLPKLMEEVAFSPAADRKKVRAWAAEQIQAPAEVMLADFVACNLFDRREALGALACPVTIVSAADDRLTPPRLQQELDALIPHARYETVSRAGHMVIRERPDAVAQLILDAAPDEQR